MMCGNKSQSTEVPETAAERALAEVSAAKWKDYQDTFVPLQNEYMAGVDRLGTESAQQGYGMMAGNIAGAQVGDVINQSNQQLFSQGINPNSGAFQTKSRVLSQAIAKTQQNARNQGMLAAQNAHIQGLSNIAAIGNGQQTTAFQGMGNIAQTAASNAINESQRTFNRTQADQQLTGQVLGAAANFGMNSYFKKPDTQSLPGAISYNEPNRSGMLTTELPKLGFTR